MKDKPRVRFCWSCGRQLYGNHHIEMLILRWSGDKIPRILHKQCGKAYDDGEDQDRYSGILEEGYYK